MNKWALGIGLVAIVLFLSAILYPVYQSPIREPSFGAYEDNWNGLSVLQERLGYNNRTIVTTPLMLDEVKDPAECALVVVGVQKEYSSIECDAIVSFVDSGGKLILANDNDLANSLSTRFGVKFYTDRVLDEAFKALPEHNISIFQANATISAKNYSVQFNSPSGLQLEPGCTVLCQSGVNSSLDLNRNGLRDMSDKRGPIPLMAMSKVRSNGGRAVFISSSAIFINQEIYKAQNLPLAQALVKNLFGLDKASKPGTVVGGEKKAEPKLIFDESRHVAPRDRQVTYNAITLLSFMSKHPALIAIVVVNIACIGLLWWLANPRPKPFRHIDRLSQSDPRPTEGMSDVKRLRRLLLLKMLEAPPVVRDGTILGVEDLDGRLKQWDAKRVRSLVQDTELEDLLLKVRPKIKDIVKVREKILRWSYAASN